MERNVIVAKSAGFCFGVERAVNLTYEWADNNGNTRNIYTYGPIIHNDEVIKDLKDKGVKVIDSIEDIEEGTVILRAHGVPKDVFDAFNDKDNIHVEDATCPFVKKIHKIVYDRTSNGYNVIVIGNPKHPEIIGICGWNNGGKLIVIQNEEDIEKIDFDKSVPIVVVAQTTFNYKKFDNLVEIIWEKGYDINIENTICNATHERQSEARFLAKKVDAMIVIGDTNSSNTQKLYEICKEECVNTYYIQTVNDLMNVDFHQFISVGITAGASTPHNIIREVQKYVRY